MQALRVTFWPNGVSIEVADPDADCQHNLADCQQPRAPGKMTTDIATF